MEHAKAHAKRAYRKLTPGSFERVWTYLILSMLAYVWLTAFIWGVLLGASKGLDGGSLGQATSSVYAVEHRMWTDMAMEGVVLRSIYGLTHWVTTITVHVSVIGVRIGYRLPALGHVMGALGQVTTGLFIVFVSMQFLRVVEFVNSHV